MQRGSIKKHGKFWVLKYREAVLVNGAVTRKDVYKKLAPIDRDHQTKESVQPLADVLLAPLNVGDRPIQSGDSLTTFLDTFVASGLGGRGEVLKPSTVKHYERMRNLLKPHLVPDIELRKVRTPYVDRVLRAAASTGKVAAHTTFRNLKAFLSTAFRSAIRSGAIDSNPVRDAAIPRGKGANTYA
jgi:hypothetical protein